MDNGASSYRRFLDGEQDAFDDIMNELFHSRLSKTGASRLAIFYIVQRKIIHMISKGVLQMFKKIFSILLIAILLFSLISCAENKSVNKTEVKNFTNDKTVDVNTFYPNEFSSTIKAGSSLDISKIYNNIDELSEDAKNIVYGTVKNIRYSDKNATAVIYYDILIEKSYKGSLNSNDIITVVSNGGYVRLATYIDVFGDARFKNYTKDEISKTVLSFSVMNAPEPKINEKYLLFLSSPIKDEFPFEDGSYAEIGGFMGRYHYEDNKLYRHEPQDEIGFYGEENKAFSLEDIDEIFSSKAK